MRQAMGAEQDLRTAGGREPSETFVDLLNQRVQIGFIAIEALDSVNRNITTEVAAPLVRLLPTVVLE